ncbi:diphthine--ammonia ligase [Rhodohalobacter sp. SW132]|uniref:Dph6-related ATP pyrophosphatase n=1 Tax=Rhodohalobacter sp. SW132 TaxID=2293433 RepID=UPI000E27972A|nr:diphthine--ammonia ligase [Rhodohalobacter sp. SW132]REL33467.1 diphthine--ammonia ligase [Rhodohalobacter sp. SW132]
MTKQSAKTIFHWSGGKDSALALHKLLQSGEDHRVRLFTAINRNRARVTMHGVQIELIRRQAKQIGLPLSVLELPDQPGMELYNKLMKREMIRHKSVGFEQAAFGDIFLEDLKEYRENQMKEVGLQSIFPIWGKDTRKLMQQFIDDGFRAIAVCVDADKLGKSFAGREIDQQFLKDLPDDVDPCGENGEFHTFVYDGPIFKQPVLVRRGDVVYREYDSPGSQNDSDTDKKAPSKMGFWFCDLQKED